MDVSYRAGFTEATRPELSADRVGTMLHRHEVPLPEDVRVGFEVASPFARMLAFLLDYAIIVGASLASVLVFIVTPLGNIAQFAPGMAIALVLLLLFVSNVGYFFIFEVFFSGQTPGKKALNLRVVKQDGEEITPRQGAVRSFLRFAIIGPVPILLIIGVFNPELLFMFAPFSALAIWMFVDRKSRGIPDLVADTLVVVQKMPPNTGNRPYVPPYFMLPYHYFPLNHSEMSKLTPLDYARLEEFGTRLSTISSSARQQAAMAAAAALARRMNYSNPIEPEYAELFLYEMHAALKQQLQQLYPDLYA